MPLGPVLATPLFKFFAIQRDPPGLEFRVAFKNPQFQCIPAAISLFYSNTTDSYFSRIACFACHHVGICQLGLDSPILAILRTHLVLTQLGCHNNRYIEPFQYISIPQQNGELK